MVLYSETGFDVTLGMQISHNPALMVMKFLLGVRRRVCPYDSGLDDRITRGDGSVRISWVWCVSIVIGEKGTGTSCSEKCSDIV